MARASPSLMSARPLALKRYAIPVSGDQVCNGTVVMSALHAASRDVAKAHAVRGSQVRMSSSFSRLSKTKSTALSKPARRESTTRCAAARRSASCASSRANIPPRRRRPSTTPSSVCALSHHVTEYLLRLRQPYSRAIEDLPAPLRPCTTTMPVSRCKPASTAGELAIATAKRWNAAKLRRVDDGEIAGQSSQRAQRRKVRRQARSNDLVDPLRLGKVLDMIGAEIAQRRIGLERIGDQRGALRCQQNLRSVTDCQKTRDVVERGAEEVSIAFVGGAAVDGRAYAQAVERPKNPLPPALVAL